MECSFVGCSIFLNSKMIPSLKLQVLTILILCSVSKAYAQQSQIFKEKKLLLTLSGGYQYENLDWSFAGNIEGRDPNVYSELIWKDLKGAVISGRVTWSFWKNFLADGFFSRSFITAGTATDTDYAEDNRTNQTFFAALDADKGSNTNAGVSLGFVFRFKRIYLIPFAGYGFTKQNLYLLDHDRDQTGVGTPLNSTYKPVWKGAILKLESGYDISKKISLKSELQYHQLDYEAKADWNLIDAFAHPVSFRHTANGFRAELLGGLSYKITPYLSALASAKYSHAVTGKGLDILYLADGDTRTTRLNGVNNSGTAIQIGLVLGL